MHLERRIGIEVEELAESQTFWEAQVKQQRRAVQSQERRASYVMERARLDREVTARIIDRSGFHCVARFD